MTSSVHRQEIKRLFHTVIETVILCIGMPSINPSIEFSCNLLRDMTRVWLLQIYLPNVTGSEGMDGPKQFRASMFHTLLEKHEVF